MYTAGCLCVVTAATGDDGAKTEPRGAHFVTPWKPKPAATRARSEGDNRPSSEIGTMSNHDHPSTFRRRFRRHVYGLYRPRLSRSGSASTRVPAEIQQLRRLRATSMNNRLPSQSRKRPEPESYSQTIERLSNIIQSLLDNSWSCAINGRNDPLDRRRSWTAASNDDEILIDKKASNIAASDQQLHRNAANSRRHRPAIDPMLMMVGIGRK